MADITIIGAGRLGTSLGRALARKGQAIKALSCRSLVSARESRRIIGQGKICRDNASAARAGDIIFLCLPDGEIESVAAELARSRIDWSKKTVFHTSGLLPATALRPLRAQGALTGSLHPIQSFARKTTPPAHFQGAFFGLEGEKKALASARILVRRIGGRPFLLPTGAKSSYHAACTIASNFLVILLDMAAGLLKQAGIEEKRADRLLFPLVEGTLHNVKKLDIGASLTGPVIRGDEETVRKHLEALRRLPEFGAIYRGLSLLALKKAEKRGLPRRKVRALKSLLEGK